MNEAVTLVSVGDIMLGRGVGTCEVADARQLLGRALHNKLRGDIVTANLECLITARGEPSRFAHAHFRTDPDFAAPLLKMFDVVTMANNHLFDFGSEGVEDTIAFLDRVGVRRVGVGATPDEAASAVRFDCGSCRVDIFGASDVTNIPDGWGGVHVASVDERLLANIVASAASGALPVVHLHAGGGDLEVPSRRVFDLHKRLRDAGARVVLGHHPHRVQGWGRWNDSLSFFSLGDFVFDKLTDGRDVALLTRIDLRTLDADVSLVQRGADLHVRTAPPDFAESRMADLHASSIELRNGGPRGPGARHMLAWGYARLVSLTRDFRAGGLGTVTARVRSKLRRWRS